MADWTDWPDGELLDEFMTCDPDGKRVKVIRDELLRRLSASYPQAGKVQITQDENACGVPGECPNELRKGEPERSDGRIQGEIMCVEAEHGHCDGVVVLIPYCVVHDPRDRPEAQRSVGRVEAGSEQVAQNESEIKP